MVHDWSQRLDDYLLAMVRARLVSFWRLIECLCSLSLILL